MTIGSMEALVALSPGEAIKVVSDRVGTKVFTRVKEGFALDDVVVEPKWFAGHLTVGEVTNFNSGNPEVGDYFAHLQHAYIILSVEATTFDMAHFNRGRFVDITTRTLAEVPTFQWKRVAPSERPDWYDMALTTMTAYASALRDSRVLRERQAAIVNERDTAIRNLNEVRLKRAAQVAVVVTGTTVLPEKKATGAIPEGVTVLQVEATWRRLFTVTTEPVAGCACAVSREQVCDLLGVEDDGSHEFTYNTDCGRHG